MTPTIAAIATPAGNGGIGIVRLSGPDALAVVARVVGGRALPDRRAVLAEARDPVTGERLDEVLVLAMRAPRSYTGEDVAELHGHGGSENLRRLLAAVVAAGAVVAAPGEFTRRAFANGRLDLTQAEGVAAVIAAGSARALRAAQRQLAGELGQRVEALRAEAVRVLAAIEASIDFPEEGLTFPEAATGLEAVAHAATELAATHALGRALHEGIEVAFVGPPNVGKSSLLNALVGEERALVAPDPGTTRDYVEVRVVWDGIQVTLVDTAGDREADTDVERRGVALGRARAGRADVRVWVHDASGAKRPAAPGSLEVWNKIDLVSPPGGALGVSARSGDGLAALRRAVLEAVSASTVDGAEGVVVATARQRGLLEAAAEAARRGAAALREGAPVELAAADLREVAARLGEITGAEVDAEVLDRLFADFCLGK